MGQLTGAGGDFPTPGTGMSEELKASLDQFIKEHKVILFMKGSKDFPQCGFSNTCVQVCDT